MNDLISRQAALAAIDKNRDALLSNGMTGAEHILVHYGRRSIEDMPTIDPVKHGKWEEHNGWKQCSYCAAALRIETVFGIKRDNFCPNCGADMRGE